MALKRTLEIFVQIADNQGQGGIKSVEALWMDTENFIDHSYKMILAPEYSKPVITNGAWFKLEEPIPLPKSGKTVRYEIKVDDVKSMIDEVISYVEKRNQN